MKAITVLALLMMSNTFTFILSRRVGFACSQANIDPQTAFGKPLPLIDLTASVTESVRL